MLSTKDLCFQYPDAIPIVFPDISLPKGEVLLICGESGSGKTTFLHLLAGLRKPTSGKTVICGEKISDYTMPKLDQFRGKHIGIVYQQSYFIQSINVVDNLVVSPYSANKAKAERISKRLRIDSLLEKKPHQLSVGQQQRLSIARAMMNDPKLILADEPTSALDDKNCKQVLNLLLEEAKINDAALIIVTHDNRLKSEIDTIIELESVLN